MSESRIQLGVIGRAHGVRGWARVTSYAANPADLTAYGPLHDARGRQFVLCWKAEGVAEISEILGGTPMRITDRTTAEKLTNTPLFIHRSALPPAEEDEFYLADLIGLTVLNAAVQPVGTVAVVHDYGGGVSLEIERTGAPPLLLPFTKACVPTVDVAAGHVVIVPPEEIVAPSADTETAA